MPNKQGISNKRMSNFIVALAAASLTFGWSSIHSLNHTELYAFSAFLSTFTVYNFQITLSALDKVAFNLRYAGSSLILGIGACSLLFSTLSGPSAFIVLLIGSLLCIFYSLPLSYGKLRNIPYLKGPLVAFVWTILIFVLPLINEGMFTVVSGIICFSVFFFFWGLIVLADIRDLQTDPITLRTMPQCLGSLKARVIAFGFFFQFHIITAIFNSNLRYSLYFHLVFLGFYGLVATLNEETKRIYFSSLDLLLILLGIVFYFA